VFYWLHPDWTSVIPQFLLIAAYSVVFVAFMVWLLGGRSSETAEEVGRAGRLAGA
jgi:hypothetical protein